MPLNENQKKSLENHIKQWQKYLVVKITSDIFYYYSSCEENNDFYRVNCHCTGVTKVRPLNNNEMSFKKMNVF